MRVVQKRHPIRGIAISGLFESRDHESQPRGRLRRAPRQAGEHRCADGGSRTRRRISLHPIYLLRDSPWLVRKNPQPSGYVLGPSSAFALR
jgi:hypothetical protein